MAFDTSNNVMGWNDEIIDDGASSELVVLPEGDYYFTVTKMTKEWQNPTAKIVNGCNKAALVLKIKGDAGDSLMYENLLLYKPMEWKLSAFFRSIGQKKHGEKLVMDWSKVPNATGYAHVKVEEFQRNDGTTGTKNVVDKYLDLPTEPWN